MNGIPRRNDFLTIGFLALLPLAYFWQVTFAQGVWFGNDIVRTYHPLGVELARALNEGRLPLWTTGMYGGFPILADAQIGALYPVNVLLFRLLPAHFALSYSINLHLAWAAVGMYLLARTLSVSRSAAMLASIVFAFNGFMFSRLQHPTVLITSAWLPWLVFFYERFQSARAQKQRNAGLWFALAAFGLGIQFLTGFPQVAFMNTLAFVVIGFCDAWLWHRSEGERRAMFNTILPAGRLIVVAVVLGAGVAAAQIIPTAELVGFSVRAAPAGFDFVTSYSLPIEYLSQFVHPFLRGEPSEGANNEYWAYIGLVPFVFALLAVFLKRDRRAIFFAIFALVALSFALGEVNPIFRLISQLPGFSFFRVPARYLLLFVFAAALLSAFAFDELSRRLSHGSKRRGVWMIGAGLVALFVFSMWVAQTQSLAFWLLAWQILPIAFALFTLGILIFAWKRFLSGATFQVVVLGLVLLDVTSAAPMFVKTLGQVTEPAYTTVVPRSIAILDERPGRERVFTDQYIFPSTPSIRGSLYPNTALLYGKESAMAYSSLASARHLTYLFGFSPAMLNVMNVRYWMIPLEPRFQTKMAIPSGAVALDVLNNEETIPPTPATAIEITSFTEQAETLVDGTLVGELDVRWRDGRIDTFPIRVGVETADWDYARKQPQLRTAQIAHLFPAYWRAFGRPFEGYVYSARLALEPGEIVGVSVRVLQPDARLTIQGITLYNGAGQARSLAKLVSKNDFQVAYFSDTVAAWKNLDALPRAFVVHSAEITDDATAFARMREPGFRPEQTLWLADGVQLTSTTPARDVVEIIDYKPERVSIAVTTDQPGYLFLADSWFPGWNAFIDGRPTPIYRANVLFRTVRIEPGVHTVVFEYRPLSFIIGGLISLGSLLILCAIAFFYFRTRSSVIQ